MVHTVNGDKYIDPAVLGKGVFLKPKIRVPWPVYLLIVLPLKAAWLLLKVLWLLSFYGIYRFGYAVIPALAVAVVFVRYGRWTGASALVVPVVGLVLWWWKARASFWRRLGWFYLAQWRRWTLYYRHWRAICTNLGLAMAFDGAKYFPTLVKVRRDGEGDLVTVRMLDGQIPQSWIKYAQNFAHTFNADVCSVRPVSSKLHRNRVVLHLKTRDSLAKTFGAFPVPAVPDLKALPIAMRGNGRKVAISLLTHVLIAGATGAGKGAVLWAILSALASWIRVGLVQVWAFDPKGGVEFDPGKRLFQRFFYGEPDEMAGALDELVKEMKRRQARQRGRGRTHAATMDTPAIVVVIDEFGALTSYLTDKKLKERINAAMSLILSQGRAVGVHVVAALQDPRKEILPFRNLFVTRIALRLTEKNEVGLILDDDSVELGATCHLIPKSLPGKAFMILETDKTPVEVKFPYHTDEDIADLADTYGTTPVDPLAEAFPSADRRRWKVNR